MDEVLLEVDKKVCFGTALNSIVKDDWVNLLKRRMANFVWYQEDVTGVDPILIIHKLSIDGSVKPIQQKKRKFTLKRRQVIKEEVNKILMQV